MAKKKPTNKNKEAWRAAHKGYAAISWTASDVLSVAPENWTEQQAEEFLECNSRRIQDRLCELGFSVIETLIQEEASNASDNA